jgi:glycosyltransferase involved in cell wall biosynthesis
MNLRNTLLNPTLQEKYQESQLEASDSYLSQLKTSDLLISVIIPVYNEEYSIKDVIERIPNHLNYEIILVDDGSTDKSVPKIKEIERDNIKILQHQKNLGYGAALITGFKNAIGDIIVTLDSDGQHCPEEIPDLIKPIINKQADIVIGSRYLGKSSYRVPTYTKIGENIISFFLWILFRQKIKNNQNGLKAFSKKSVKIFNSMMYNRFGLCTEIIFKAAYYKFKLLEIPASINSRKHGASYVNILRLFIAISTCILVYGLKKVITIFIKQNI